MSWAPNKWSINKGSEAKIVVHVLDHNGDPLNISGATAISLCIKKMDGPPIIKAAESGWSYGEPMDMIFIYGFTFTAEETALLNTAENQNVLIRINFGDNVKSYLIAKSLTVRDVQL